MITYEPLVHQKHRWNTFVAVPATKDKQKINLTMVDVLPIFNLVAWKCNL